MRFRLRRVAALLALAVTASGLTGVASASAAPTDDVAAEWPDPNQFGPFAVGRTTFELTDPARDGRTFKVDAWYPSDRGAVFGVPKSIIDLTLTTLESPRAYDNPRVAAVPGGFPLVVFSHGTVGIRFQSYFLMEFLASHGYVVVAPDHPGHTIIDKVFGTMADFDQSFRDRPLDLSLTIDRMLERNATPGDRFEGRIDGSRIAAMGHSVGAVSALMMRSGWVDPSHGIDVAPDPRVDVTIPIAPAVMLLGDYGSPVTSLEGPMMLIGGTADRITPLTPNSDWTYEVASNERRFRADVDGAGHTSFSNVCDFQRAFNAAPNMPANVVELINGLAASGCGPTFRSEAEVQHCTDYYALVFLNRVLKGEAAYTKYLSHGLSQRLPVHYIRGNDPATL